MKLSKDETAQLLGVDLKSVARFITEGMPFVEKGNKGKPWVIDATQAVEWYKNRAVTKATSTFKVDKEELIRRKLEADTTIAEVNAARELSEVCENEDVYRSVVNDYITVRQSMLSLPARVAPLIVGEKSERIIKDAIKKEIIDSLNNLSSQYYRGFDDDDDEDESE